jgi:hypothetical protein
MGIHSTRVYCGLHRRENIYKKTDNQNKWYGLDIFFTFIFGITRIVEEGDRRSTVQYSTVNPTPLRKHVSSLHKNLYAGEPIPSGSTLYPLFNKSFCASVP